MATNKVQTGLRINETTYTKFRYLCTKEKRSLNNMIEYVLQQYVEQYEKENGAIPIETESIN